jgi:hypothetical protein
MSGAGDAAALKDDDNDGKRYFGSQPATVDELVAYANCVLHATLAGDADILKRWGRTYVDISSEITAKDRNGRSLGIDIYKAYLPSFAVIGTRHGAGGAVETERSGVGGGGIFMRQARSSGDEVPGPMGGDAPFKAQLVLTVDLRAKIVRTKTLLELLYGDRGTYSLSPDEQRKAKQKWEGTVIIHRNEKRCKRHID